MQSSGRFFAPPGIYIYIGDSSDISQLVINPFTANPVKALHFAIGLTHNFSFLTSGRSGDQD